MAELIVEPTQGPRPREGEPFPDMPGALLYCLQVGVTVPSWSTLRGKAPRVSGHAAAVTEAGRVLLFGGLTDGAGSPCTNDLWSCEDGAWSKLAPAGDGPGVRMYPASAIVDSSLYVFGGWDPAAPGSGGSFLDDVYKLDVASLTWERLVQPMPCGPVSRHSACTVGKDVVVVTFRGVTVLDGATGEMREQPTTGEAPVGLSMCAAAPLGESSMLVFGGSTKTQGMSADVHVLDTTSWAWRKLRPEGSAEDGRVPTPRGSSSAAPEGEASCLIFGGAGLGGGGYEGGAGLRAFDETWRVRVDGDVARWECVHEGGDEGAPAPRVAASLSALPSGAFLLQGGWDPKSKDTFDEPHVLSV